MLSIASTSICWDGPPNPCVLPLPRKAAGARAFEATFFIILYCATNAFTSAIDLPDP